VLGSVFRDVTESRFPENIKLLLVLSNIPLNALDGLSSFGSSFTGIVFTAGIVFTTGLACTGLAGTSLSLGGVGGRTGGRA